MKILYVEDNPHDVELIRRQFAQSAPEWRLTTATTLTEARQQVAQEDYHVVLIDLSLPDGRGLDFLAELLSIKPNMAAIVVTGSGSEETAIAALKIGACDYVIKSGDYLERLPALIEQSYKRHLQEQDRRKSGLKVLYVEHDAADIELTQRHLARYAPHIQIEFVHTVAELLSRLPETADKNAPYPYDVLLIDYKLPGLNALDALKIIRHERGLTLPIILTTGQGSEEIAVQAIRLGATNYLVKHSGYLVELPGALENAHYHAELQREQAALRESEARFRRLVENAQDVIYRINLVPEQRFEFVSPSVLAMTGYTPDDHYNDPLLGYKIVHPDDKHLLESALENPDSISEPLCLRWTRKDGRVIWVEQRNLPIFNEQGQMVAVEGVARDMTEQQNLLAAVRQQEQQFATLAQNADDLIARFDRELRHLYVNPAVEKLAGIPLADYVGKTNAELGMPAEQVAFWDQEMRRVLETAVPNAISFQFTGVDKRPRHFEAQITPEFDDEGEVVSLLSLVRDITNRVAAQEQLQTQGAALNAAANGIVITDVHGTIQWVNPAFTTLTGYTLEEAVGKNPRDLVKSGVHGNLLYQDLWETILSGAVWQGEMVNRRKDGRLYSEEQTITPVFDKAGKITHFIAIKQDISERKAGEESLRRSEERFRALIERGNDAILLLDPDGLILYQSPNTERLMPDRIGQMVGQNVFDLFGDEDLPRMTRLFTKVLLQPNEPLEAEFALWQGDGSLRWVEASLNNLLDFPAVQAIVVNYRDITGRKQDQETIKQAQKLAQATIDALNAHIAVLDENGVIQAVNRSWLTFAQANDGTLAQVGEGVNYLEVCDRTTGSDQETAAQVAAGIRAVIAGKDSFHLEYPCHAPHQRRWFNVQITPLPTDDLNLHWVAVAHEDVTARKLAQEAVKRSARYYRLLFDSNPQPMWVYDLKTLAFLAVNNAAVRQYGYSRSQFLSMTLKDIRPIEDVPQLLEDLARPRPTLQHFGEWRHRLRDGRIIDVEIRSHQMHFDGRDAALVVAFDITERKQAQAEREAQARRLQQIIDALPGGIVMVDNQGQIKLANPQGVHYLREVAGLSVGEQIVAIASRPIADIFKQAPEQIFAFAHHNAYFELRAQAVDPDNPDSDWALLLQDVTEEEQKQRYLRVQDRLATVGQMAAGIAHDFNNVMGVIILYAQFVRQKDDLSEKSQEYLKTIEEQGRPRRQYDRPDFGFHPQFNH
jgi:PAS domain S-box-containing protein